MKCFLGDAREMGVPIFVMIMIREDINSNLMVKFAYGLCNTKEAKYMKKWIKKDPNNQVAFQIINTKINFSGAINYRQR